MLVNSWSLTLLLALAIPLILGGLVGVGSKASSYESSRLEAFECGFEAISSARSPFSLKFFMLVVVFLVFDVEVALVLPIPLAKSLMALVWWGWVSLALMLILILGLVLEFSQGVFEWSE